ncbi:hypothetical protein [Rhizohabitans arisaemae]|uniref:hypothetical protein n=1 Tax=Rhizohabitans arisaemae TaxID=2720610 RepID=UPI0024B25F82|nr:hypothetical protein [Rhizohabitans arisaemae]
MSDQVSDIRTCGRPTKSGKPCRVRLYGFDVACGVHATEHDRELAQAYGRGHNEGLRLGKEKWSGEQRIEWLEQRVKELEALLDEASRVYEVDGDQVVEVGKYAYRWRGSMPLEVGDRVLLPENWLSRMKDGPGAYQDVVTKLGSTYRGEMSRILSRVSKQ